MNARQRRKRMRAYGRATGLDAVPFEILRIAASARRAGSCQAEELISALNIPRTSIAAHWGIRGWSEMAFYDMSVRRGSFRIAGLPWGRWEMLRRLAQDYHCWREQRAGEGR